MTAAATPMAKARSGPSLVAQPLFYPVTDATLDTASSREFVTGYFLRRDAMRWFCSAPSPEHERGSMSRPFIFIATNRLKPGAYEAERQRVPGLVEFIGAVEPRLLAFNEYINAERTEVTVVQVHPDATSMEFHMGVVGERAAQAYAETLDATTQIQVFGTPSDAVVETLRAQAGAGVPLSVHPEHLGGFTRIGEHLRAG